MWTVALSDLTCVRAAESGADELIVLVSVVGTLPDDTSQDPKVTGLYVNDCNSGFKLIDKGKVGDGVFPVREFLLVEVSPNIVRPGGVELSQTFKWPPEQQSPVLSPGTPIVIRTIGIEQDGTDSVSTQAHEYADALLSTSSIDTTVGVDDELLWDLTWEIRVDNDEVSVANIRPATPSPDPSQDSNLEFTSTQEPIKAFLPSSILSFFGLFFSKKKRSGFLRHSIVARNTDENSEYNLEFSYIWRENISLIPSNLKPISNPFLPWFGS